MARTPAPKVSIESLQSLGGTVQTSLDSRQGLAEGKPVRVEGDPSPTGGALSSGTMTASQVEDLKDFISEASNSIRNPLGDYEGVAYHWKMFMTEDLSTAQALNFGQGSSDISASQVLDSLDGQRKIIVAESGVTTGFNIQDVRLEQVVGPSFQNRNTNTTRITMTIVEPLGTSFLEKIKNAAIDLNIRNFNKVFYYLELSFKAYDTEGNPVNPAEKMDPDTLVPNGGRWVYQVQITDIQTQLDTSGSTYVITCIPYNEGAYTEDIMYAPQSFSGKGRTIGEFLDDLKTQMTEAFETLYGPSYLEIDFVTHPIRHSRFQDENPKDWPISPQEGESESQRGLSWKGLTMVKINKGTSISDVIEFVFANTEKGQQIAKDVARNGDTNESSDKSTIRRFRECVLFRIEPDIDITGYSSLFSNYKRKVTFHIWAYATQAPVISEAQNQDAKNKAVQVQMVNELKNKGFLRKRYDYYFTGLNTEVIRLDVKYNLAWTAVLPLTMGERSTIESASVHATLSERTKIAQLKSTTIKKITDEIETLEAKRTDAISQAELLNKSGQSELATNQYKEASLAYDEIQKKTLERSKIVQERNQYLEGIERDTEQYYINKPSSSQNQDYAEGLRDIPTSDELPLHISFSYADTQPKQTGTGTTPLKSADRGYYGAILEQLYGPVTTGLINVELEIRGDPYWLGYSNLERKLHMSNAPPDLSPNAAMPNTQEGDCTFLLKFDFPYDIDPNTGDPVFRKGGNDERLDTFNGLYRTIRVIHNFVGGQFTSVLHGSRLPLIDLARVLGYSGGIDSVDSVQTPSNAARGTRPAGASGPATPTSNPTISRSVQARARDKVETLMANPRTRAIADQIIAGTKARGYSHDEAVGVLANGIIESSLDPTAKNFDGERSYGIFQLNANGGVGKGKPVSEMLTVDGNLRYILDEADRENFGGMDNSNPAKAAVNFMIHVEKPKDQAPNGENAQKRAATAEALMKYYPGS